MSSTATPPIMMQPAAIGCIKKYMKIILYFMFLTLLFMKINITKTMHKQKSMQVVVINPVKLKK